MKDSDYIIIDSTELKALFAPKQATDEMQLSGTDNWTSVVMERANDGFDIWIYRRLRSRAWIKIADKPVQYPAWLLYSDSSVAYFQSKISVEDIGITHWQPADAAPAPPSDGESEHRHRALINHLEQDKHANGSSFNEGWQAALAYERSKPK